MKKSGPNTTIAPVSKTPETRKFLFGRLFAHYAVGRKDSRALFEGSLVFLRVFAAEFAPVAPVVAVDSIDRRLSLALKGSSGLPSKHGEKQRQDTQGKDQQGQTYGEGKKGKKAQEK